MDITIVGAGAIGGYIAARLSASGQAVTLLARGNTLRALQEKGIGWQEQEGEATFYPVRAVASGAEAGLQDLLIIALKEPALAGLITQIHAMIGPNTQILTAMNGIPWWFTAGISGARNQVLSSLDPHGELARLIPVERLFGCVLHMACTSPRPGIVRHVMGNRMMIGQATTGLSDTLETITRLLQQAGFEASTSAFIQKDIWFKLWGNMTHNPISALTCATTDQIIEDPLTCELAVRIMTEARHVGARIGCHLDQDPAARNQEALKLGAFKTSMLQDTEAGKPLEINALLGAFCELAEQLDEPAPHARSLLGLVRLFEKNRRLQTNRSRS
jgi:2-dehydropantoate 2-reductase